MKKSVFSFIAIAALSANSLIAAGQHSSSIENGPKISDSQKEVTTIAAEKVYRQASEAIGSPKLKKNASESENFVKLERHRIERQESRARQLRG